MVCIVGANGNAHASSYAGYVIHGKDIEEARTWIIEGFDSYNAGNYEEAIKCYDAAIKLSPKSEIEEAGWAGKALALHELGRSEESIGCYYKMINVDSYTDLIADDTKEDLLESISGSARVSILPALAAAIIASAITYYFTSTSTGSDDTYKQQGSGDEYTNYNTQIIIYNGTAVIGSTTYRTINNSGMEAFQGEGSIQAHNSSLVFNTSSNDSIDFSPQTQIALPGGRNQQASSNSSVNSSTSLSANFK